MVARRVLQNQPHVVQLFIVGVLSDPARRAGETRVGTLQRTAECARDVGAVCTMPLLVPEMRPRLQLGVQDGPAAWVTGKLSCHVAR